MFMRHGLQKRTLFQQNVGINKLTTMDEFMRRARGYIDYEEAEAVSVVDTTSSQAKAKDEMEKRKKDQGSRFKEWRGGHFDYSGLTITREKLLAECTNIEFRDLKWSTLIPQRRHTNKRAYCRYYRSNGHDTEQCRVLKDDIEDLIQKRKLKQYLKSDDKKRERSPKKAKAAVNEVTGSPTDCSGDNPRGPRGRGLWPCSSWGDSSWRLGELRAP